MRQVCYLHLSRMVQSLLDRKDRMSMAVGLEVRVPFCDHRLVQYVFNTPWSMKTFDGREKSILREATRDLLPDSVVQRKKSGYPGSFDPNYVSAIQAQTSDLLASGHPALDLFHRTRLQEAVGAERTTITTRQRSHLERALDMATWFDQHKPDIRLN